MAVQARSFRGMHMVAGKLFQFDSCQIMIYTASRPTPDYLHRRHVKKGAVGIALIIKIGFVWCLMLSEK